MSYKQSTYRVLNYFVRDSNKKLYQNSSCGCVAVCQGPTDSITPVYVQLMNILKITRTNLGYTKLKYKIGLHTLSNKWKV